MGLERSGTLFRFDGYQDEVDGNKYPMFTILKAELFYIGGAKLLRFVPDTTGGPKLLTKYGCTLPSEFGDLDPQKGDIFEFNV